MNRMKKVIVYGVKSDWQLVSSGSPLGSVLRPQVFATHINDLDIRINNSLSKSADNKVST